MPIRFTHPILAVVMLILTVLAVSILIDSLVQRTGVPVSFAFRLDMLIVTLCASGAAFRPGLDALTI